MKTLALRWVFLLIVSATAIGQNVLEDKLPAVVEVRVNTADGVRTGSGFIVDASGTVVTCFHILDGAQNVAVRMHSGETFSDIRVLAFDASRDLALVKFAGYGAPTIELGDSDAIRVGDAVYAIGNPSSLEHTVTRGIVSAVRTVDGVKVVQTDAAASPGNSGGPLLNEHGESIGVVSFKLSGEGLNFAIPSNYVRGLLGMQMPQTLEQFNASIRETAEAKALFTEGDSDTLSGKWRSLDTNTIKVLQQDGDYVHGESLSRDEQQAFATYDMKTQPDGTIAGRVKGQWGCRWWSPWAFPNPNWRENQCEIENHIVLTKVDQKRIEGYILGPKAPPANHRSFAVFCKNCGLTYPKVKQQFVWVRMN